MRKHVLAVMLGVAGSTWGHAAELGTLTESAREAVRSHPEVLAKWHQMKSVGHDRENTLGRFLPTVDLLFGIGDTNRNTPTYIPPGERDYRFETRKLTIRQNLFEGFATTLDASRLAYAELVRYYELLDLSETAALEAAKAHIDVWRYRQLVSYAEESYATHRVLYEKIRERAETGVGRKVDLETAAGRLALSESNLLTETSNLHDVTARYQRVVGKLPPADLSPPKLRVKDMPEMRYLGVNRALQHSPAIKAAMNNIFSALRQADVQRTTALPRVDTYLETVNERNAQGYEGTTKDTTLAVTVTWNLFDGGKMINRSAQAGEEANSAKDLREKVCRDVIQNSAIAMNDYARLGKQLPLLDQHQLSTDKAREAFRRQFDIGQRTLLDVLDTENEYYTARRNYLNGEMDQLLAQVRYLGAAGQLLTTLGLTPVAVEAPASDGEAEEGTINGCLPEGAPPKKKDSYLVLLNNADGTTGKVVMQGDKGEQVIATAKFGVPLDGSEKPAQVSDEKIASDFADAMSARPQLPEHFTINFELGSVKMTKDGPAVLEKIFQSIRSRPVPEVVVVGHADASGNPRINEKISAKRAAFVADQIRAKGLATQSVTVDSRGEAEPVLPSKQPELKNRRVVISVR